MVDPNRSGDTDYDAIVVGAGITGLACAHALDQAGFRILVLEERDRVGGCIETVEEDGFTLECGPHTLRDRDPALLEHFREIGVEDDLLPLGDAGGRRFIVRNGEVVELPSSPGSFFSSPFLSAGGKLRLFREPFVRPLEDEDPSLGVFVGHRLGREVARGPLDAFAGGIWAGDPDRISARAAFPSMVDGAREHGSIFRWALARRKARKEEEQPADPEAARRLRELGVFGIRGGLRRWPERIAERLGAAVRTGTRVASLDHDDDTWSVSWTAGDGGPETATARHVVLSGGPRSASTLASAWLPDEVADALDAMRSASMVIVHLGYDADAVPQQPHGFGVLMPRAEGRRCLGILFVSSAIPARAPDGMLTTSTFMGGIRSPEVVDRTDDELVADAHAEHEALLGFRSPPRFHHIRRWREVLPQYELGHPKLLAALDDLDGALPTLHLAGRYRGGVSVPDCWRRGRDRAAKIIERLGTQPTPTGRSSA